MKRKKYSREFKLEAVKLLTEQGYTYQQASEAVGVTPQMLNRWKREFKARGELAFPGNGKLPDAEQELQELRDENRRLRMEREILKKAAAFFAQEEN